METLFIQPEEQTEEPKLFTPSEEPAPVSAPLSESQKYTTSLLAAMAQRWNSTSEQSLANITGLLTNRINAGEEQNIRDEIADAQRQKQIQSISEEQLEALKRGEISGSPTSLKGLMEKQFGLQTAPTNQYALEEEGIEAIQNMGASDPAQASAMSLNGDSLEAAYEANSKFAIFNRFLNQKVGEVAQVNAEWYRGLNPFSPGGQSVVESLFDMLFIPGQSWWTQTAASEADSSFLPGFNLEESVGYLNSLPLEQYKEELPKVWDKLMSNSGLFKTNPSMALNALKHLGPTSGWAEAAEANFDAGFDVVTTIPFAAAARLARKPINMIQMAGNRKAAVQTAAAAIQKDAMGMPDSAAGGLGDLTSVNSGAVEASIPAYVKPDIMDYVSPWVGIPSDVADALKSIQAAAARVPKMTAMGWAPEVVQKNIISYIDDLTARFRRQGEDIADVHRSTIAQDMASLKGEVGNYEDIVERLEIAAGLRAPKATTDYPGGGKRFSAFDIDTEHKSMMADFVREGEIAQKGRFEDQQRRYPKRVASMSVQEIIRKYGVDWNTAAGIKRGTVEFFDQVPHAATPGELPPIVNPKAAVGTPLYDQPKFHSALEEGLPPMVEPELPPIILREIKDRLHIEADANLGVTFASFYLGNGARAGGYMTRELAQEGAAKRGLVGHHVIQSNGQYYIKVTEAIPETGSATPRLNDDLYPVNVVSAWLRNPQQALPDLINDARLAAVLERGNIEADVFQPIAKFIHVLSPKQVARHNKIVGKGQDQEKVFKVDELTQQYEAEFGRGPTEKEIVAYYAHIELNEAADAMINDYLYGLRAKGGWQTGQINPDKAKAQFAGMFSETENVRFGTGRMNMREIHNPEWSQLRVFDFDENLTLHPGQGPAVSDLRAKAQDKWNTGNYRMVELEEEIIHNGDPVKFVLVHKGSSLMGPLERRQRKAAPWGRKENLNKHFVSQARTGTFKGTNVGYALNPVIHLSERTATRARDRVKQLEEARMAWNKEGMYENVDEAVRRGIIEKASESMEKWSKMVDDGIIQPQKPFRYVEDRELPSEYNSLPDGSQRWFNQEWTGSDHYYTSRRELYYQTDRDMLLDSSENRLRNLDPTRVLDRAINTAINTKAFANYNQNVIEDWVRRLPDGAIVESSVGYSKDPYTSFFHGRFSEQFKKGETSALYRRLEANRRIHWRFMNYQNNEMKLREMFNRRIASWIDGKGKTADWAATKFYDSQSRNPVDAVQGFVFDSYLGFYNPDQFFVQAQTAVLAMATHPIYGVQAAAMSPWMTHLLLNRSDNLLDLYAKRLRHIHGLPEDEFKLMVNTLKGSGWMKVQGSALQLDYLTNRVGGGMIGKAFGKFRRGGRVLFNMAERYNRLTGFQIAWHDTRKHFPDLKPGSPEFLQKVRQETDGLTMNMTAASKTAWQGGLAAVPTKFLAYQAHVLENLLPKKFGGSTKLRGEQKFRLAVGQLGLYGLGGGAGLYSLSDYIQDSYKANVGSDMPEEAYKAMTRGVMDSMVSTIFGIDTDMSSRVGFGSGMLNWYEKLTEGDFATSVDIFGGPTASLSSSWIDGLTKVSRYIRSAEIHEITAEEWQLAGNDFMQSVKSWSRFAQFWAVYKSGQLKDRKTGQPIVAVGELQAFSTLLGFPMGSQTEFWREMKTEKGRTELSNELASQLAMLRRLGFKALEDGDDKAAFNYNQSEGRIFNLIGDDYQMKQLVARKLTQLLGYNDYNVETMQQRIMQNQGRAPRAGRQ